MSNHVLGTAAGGSVEGSTSAGDASLLEISDLTLTLETDGSDSEVLSEISLKVRAGERVGIVGESGCGKSMTALSIVRLLPPRATIAGSIWLEGQDLVSLNTRAIAAIRGRKIGMVFQEPMSSLNPVMRIGDQLIEGMQRHMGLSRRAALERAGNLLSQVGIPKGRRLLDEYPHQLSGGMRQRVMIAIALACEPRLLIADEPTTALDVSIQAEILRLLRSMQEAYETGLLLISHDLGVVADVCDRIIVMYAGQVVEQGPTSLVLGDPRHPYTEGLVASNPALSGGQDRLRTIPGSVPDLRSMPPGCRFAPRCSYRTERCDDPPALESVGAERRLVRCWHPVGLADG